MRDQQQQQDQQRQQRQRQATATATAAASGHQRPQQQINQQRQQQSSQHANITVSQSGTTGLLALPQQPQPLRRSPRRHPSSYLNQGQQQETQQLQASSQPETKTTTTTTRNAKRPRKSSGGSTHQKESELMQQQQTQQMPLRKQPQQQKQQQKQQQQQQQQGRSSSVDAADDGNISGSGNEPKRRRSDSSTYLFASSLISVTEGTRLVNLDASQFLLSSQSSTTFPLISTQSMIGRGMTYESVCMIWSPSTPKSRKVPKELIKTVHDLFSDISNMGSSFIHRNRYWRTQCPVDVHQAQAAFQYINDHFPAELQRAVLTGMASAARKFVKANGMLMEYHLGLLMWLLINPLVATYCNEKMPDYNQQQQQQHSSQSNKDEARGGIVGYEMVTLSLEFLCSLSIPLKQRIVTLLIAPQPEPPSDPNAPNAFMYESCEQVNDAKSKARSLRVFVKAIQAVITARVEHIANNERAGSVTAEASNSAVTTATATAVSNTTAATTETQSTDSEPMDIEETTTTPETATAASTDQAPIQTASPQQAPSQPLPPRDPFAIINSNAIIAGLRPPAAFAALSLRNQQLRNLALPGSAPNPALANGNSNASMKGLVYHKDVLIARSLKYLTFLQRLNLTHGELWFTSNYSSTGTLYNALGMNSNQHPSQSQSGSDKAGSSTSTSTSTSTESKVTAYIHNGINDICLLFSGTPPDSMTLRAIDNREDGLLLPNEFYNESLSRTICIATEVTINRDQGITDAFSSTNDTCFHHYPFVLTPLAKAELMRHENLSEQRQELHDAFFRAMFVGMTCPYLIIEVRREHVVRDALVQLWGKSTNDLKKALKVRFVGEEGVDEGGVTREFLSLVVREIFNSEYGMFRYYEDSHLYWFRLAPQCDVLVNPSKYLTEPWSSSPSGKSIEEYALRVRQQYLSDSSDMDIEISAAPENNNTVNNNTNGNNSSNPNGNTNGGRSSRTSRSSRSSRSSSSSNTNTIHTATATGTTFEMPSNLDKNMINEYRLIGQLIGLAAYNSAMVGINFPRALYRKLCGRRVRLCDLAEFEPELARGLQMMLDYETDDPDEFELLFGRNFVMEYDHFGEMVTQPLVHGGESIPLTLANRQEYVNLYVEMVLSILVYRQYEAFREGFHSIMGSPHQLLAQNLNPSPSRSYLIESLEPHELELIICGHNYDNLDLHELESVCQYDGGYNRESSVICNFWDVVHNDFTVEQRRLLLKFVTGTDRVPVGGFSKLTFVISKNGVGESDRLPTAHTCFNVMLLCEYETRETLKDRLLTAINNAEGFGMH